VQLITELALQKATRGVFPREEAAHWIHSRGASLDGRLKRAVACGEVWRIHRGLYGLTPRFSRDRIDPLEIAQRVCGPSYISLETALSQHAFIPEAVRAITSVAAGRSRTFDTPVGLFTFTRVPQRRFLAGVRRVATDAGGAYFLATPLKALADLVYVQRHRWTGIAPVVESLRVDVECLERLTREQFDEVMSAYGPGRTTRFLEGLRRELKL
jgi:hypothetical protein